MYIKKFFIVLICGFTFLGPALKTYAAKGHKMSLEEQQAVGLISTGLKPLYPIQDSCLEVSSPFASLTRYDGSQRTPFSNHGYHGGMDISLKIGTPIIAVADGVVVGSAIVDMVGKQKSVKEILEFVKSLTDGAHKA